MLLGPANRYVHSAYQVSDLDALAAGVSTSLPRDTAAPGASGVTSRAARSSTTGAIPTGSSFSWSSTSPMATCSTPPSNRGGHRRAPRGSPSRQLCPPPRTSLGLRRWNPSSRSCPTSRGLSITRTNLTCSACWPSESCQIMSPLRSPHRRCLVGGHTGRCRKSRHHGCQHREGFSPTAMPWKLPWAATRTVPSRPARPASPSDDAMPSGRADDDVRVHAKDSWLHPKSVPLTFFRKLLRLHKRPQRSDRQASTRPVPRLRGGDRAGGRP